MRFAKEVDRPNLYVKIPATEPGLGAIEDCIAQGRPINVTLIFSLERYAAVAEAYIRGLERLVAAGGDPATVASVASFFVSRVDTEADKRLEEVGRTTICKESSRSRTPSSPTSTTRALPGAALGLPRRQRARAPQRCLWASTSTKNPDYRDVMYVEELIGPETVNTMPLETVEAFQDHGEVAPGRSRRGSTRPSGCSRISPRAGVDYDDVVATLEEEGVQKFADSFDELLEGIRAKRSELAPA